MITMMITFSSTSHVPTPVLSIQALPHRILTMTLHGRTAMLSHFTGVEMEEAKSIKIRPSFPHSQSFPWGSFHKPLIFLHQKVKKWKVNLLSPVPLFATPWTVAYQAPPSMGFFRQEYWSGLPFFFSRGSSQPRDQTLVSCIPGRFFTVWATGET